MTNPIFFNILKKSIDLSWKFIYTIWIILSNFCFVENVGPIMIFLLYLKKIHSISLSSWSWAMFQIGQTFKNLTTLDVLIKIAYSPCFLKYYFYLDCNPRKLTYEALQIKFDLNLFSSMKMVSNAVKYGRIWQPLSVQLFWHQDWGGHNKKY